MTTSVYLIPVKNSQLQRYKLHACEKEFMLFLILSFKDLTFSKYKEQ
jgi:hypothetical protein